MYVEIMTRKVAAYFCGELRKDTFPFDDKNFWHLGCESLMGGSRPDFFVLLDLKCSSRKQLIDKLRRYARQRKLIIRFFKK